jgi:dihydroorotase
MPKFEIPIDTMDKLINYRNRIITNIEDKTKVMYSMTQNLTWSRVSEDNCSCQCLVQFRGCIRPFKSAICSIC